MKTEIVPIFDIHEFVTPGANVSFYAENFKTHFKKYGHLRLPHKHNFYLSVLFTKGSGVHEIDFNTYFIKPGTIFMMAPGQMHNWQLSNDIDGYIFVYTKEFFEQYFLHEQVGDFLFYSFLIHSPQIILAKEQAKRIEESYREITEEYQKDEIMKFQKISSLVNLLYINLSRENAPTVLKRPHSSSYAVKLKEQQCLIDAHFKSIKSPKIYAAMMNISEKHLNRICKTCINKTASSLITERIILESKRMLVFTHCNISEITSELGYEDKSYFSRFFKKNTGKTPQEYLNENRS